MCPWGSETGRDTKGVGLCGKIPNSLSVRMTNKPMKRTRSGGEPPGGSAENRDELSQWRSLAW